MLFHPALSRVCCRQHAGFGVRLSGASSRHITCVKFIQNYNSDPPSSNGVLTMASAADVRSILSLPSSAPGPSQPQPKKPIGQSNRKPEGISRELFALIGPSAPSIAAQLVKPRLKQKPNLGSGGGKVKWYEYICLILTSTPVSDGNL